MAEAAPRAWTVEDFLRFEAQEDERYEFVDGVILMMTGGSIAHSVIKLNLGAELRAALRGGRCRAFPDGVKVVTGSAVTCRAHSSTRSEPPRSTPKLLDPQLAHATS